MDNGIGMSKEELIHNLGTMVKTDIKDRIAAISEGGGLSMTGARSRVGFFSVYLVAKRVIVISKSHDDSEQYRWEWDGGDNYTVVQDKGERLTQGTKIIMHMKEDQHEFLDVIRLIGLKRKYPEFNDLPIEFFVKKSIENAQIESDHIR